MRDGSRSPVNLAEGRRTPNEFALKRPAAVCPKRSRSIRCQRNVGRWKSACRSEAHGSPSSLFAGRWRDVHAADGNVLMQILKAVVKAAGSFDPEKIRNALASITVPTIRGTYKANEQGMSPIEPLAFQIRNGKRLIVWPAHAAEAKFLPMPRWEDRAKK